MKREEPPWKRRERIRKSASEFIEQGKSFFSRDIASITGISSALIGRDMGRMYEKMDLKRKFHPSKGFEYSKIPKTHKTLDERIINHLEDNPKNSPLSREISEAVKADLWEVQVTLKRLTDKKIVKRERDERDFRRYRYHLPETDFGEEESTYTHPEKTPDPPQTTEEYVNGAKKTVGRMSLRRARQILQEGLDRYDAKEVFSSAVNYCNTSCDGSNPMGTCVNLCDVWDLKRESRLKKFE